MKVSDRQRAYEILCEYELLRKRRDRSGKMRILAKRGTRLATSLDVEDFAWLIVQLMSRFPELPWEKMLQKGDR